MHGRLQRRDTGVNSTLQANVEEGATIFRAKVCELTTCPAIVDPLSVSVRHVSVVPINRSG
jgi:hypothetical protein